MSRSLFDNAAKCTPYASQPSIEYGPGTITTTGLQVYSSLRCDNPGNRGCNFCIGISTFLWEEPSPGAPAPPPDWDRVNDADGNPFNPQVPQYSPLFQNYSVDCGISNQSFYFLADLMPGSTGRWYYTTMIQIYYMDCGSKTSNILPNRQVFLQSPIYDN